MKTLLNTVIPDSPISMLLKERLSADFQQIGVDKGKVLLNVGSRADYLYFIEKGILHNYYYHNGKKITSWFYVEGQFITSWFSFYTRKGSFEEIEALENALLYRISYTDYQKIITDFPDFGNFARQLNEDMLVAIDLFSKSWSFLSAKERYELFQNYFPKTESRVKLGLIASFLGISQETLSRIRGQR